jgi:predicted dehydrogenase
MKKAKKNINHKSRRHFLKKLSFSTGVSALTVPAFLTQSCNLLGKEQLGQIPGNRQIGIALVGLGEYSTDQLGPALLETEYCRLAGVVTGTPASGERFRKKYGFPSENIYNYENFDQIANNEDIDIIYLVLPPVLHPEFAIRAFEAGKHVICEKPIAPSVEEAEQMIAARDAAGKLMSVGYRLHFDPYHREIMELGQNQAYGSVNKMESQFKLYVDDPENWRARRELGGGSVWDMGIYNIQAACYTLGEDPIAVTATELPKQRPDIFEDVDEAMEFELEFPSGAIAKCESNFWAEADRHRAEAENGWFELEPAFYYSGQRGETNDRVIHHGQVNQQARQMDDFAQRVINNDVNTPVPGEMGLRDVRIIEAVYQSAANGGERIPLNL